MDINVQKNTQRPVPAEKQRTYNDVVEFLDAHWSVKQETNLARMKKLDEALQSPSKTVPTILVAGTNGKTLTIDYTTKLLRAEKLTVGTFVSPHILNYNERITLNNESMSNKLFTEIANEVIEAAEKLHIEAHSSEILAAMALLYFKRNNVDVAIMEVTYGACDPLNLIDAKVVTITRITPTTTSMNEEQIHALAAETMSILKKGAFLVSGDQNKSVLQVMQNLTKQQGGIWGMPIRKLASLPYPFEQLHGRCAALAERIAQAFVEQYVTTAAENADSLLAKPKGQRGRPTLEAKRQSELNPKKTIEQFWKEVISAVPGKFEVLDKEKPTVLLDTADNIDAFKNLLLGVRLLHYQRPLKGLTIVVGASHNSLHNEEFVKLVRYFFKKTSGQIFICPLDKAIPGTSDTTSWNAEVVANDLKGMKVKARAFTSFEEAFDQAKKSVDERQGLVVVTGSTSLVNAYWKIKGIKKF